jgi:secreted Zn-dependent insulinase-like peptidase
LYENDSYTELDSCRRFIIEKHGGKFQATCGFQHATYSFQINPKFLAGALDRFGAMFVVPHYLELPDDFVEEQRKE